jgi:hypothetical protein
MIMKIIPDQFVRFTGSLRNILAKIVVQIYDVAIIG